MAQTSAVHLDAPQRAHPLLDGGEGGGDGGGDAGDDFFEYKVCSMGEPSSGAITMLQILKIFEYSPTWHTYIEASKLAFADRNYYIADSDFVDTPGRKLLADEYIKNRYQQIGNEILKSIGLRNRGVKIISCPSCARQGFEVIETVKILEDKLSHIKESITLSVIGCVVNGPGEASLTDIGITGGGKDSNMLYLNGIQSQKLRNKEIISKVSELEGKLGEALLVYTPDSYIVRNMQARLNELKPKLKERQIKGVEIAIKSAEENIELKKEAIDSGGLLVICLLYTSPSPRDRTRSRMPSSA